MKHLLITAAFSLAVLIPAHALTEKQAEKWMQIAKGGKGSLGQVKCKRGKIYDRRKKRCVVKNAATLDDDSRIWAGVWLAKANRHGEAIDVLNSVRKKSNTIALTYLGYSHRKLGRVTKAFGYYNAALASDPKNWIARSYLGEAHIKRGNMKSARSELARIKAGCGTRCSTYKRLAGAVRIAQ